MTKLKTDKAPKNKKEEKKMVASSLLRPGKIVAIFGYNNIAQKHLTGLQEVLGNDLTGTVVAAGRNVIKAKAMTEPFGDLEVFQDWQKLLAEKKPKLVIIATPNFTHAEMAITSLKSGAHVLCEKPLGVSTEQVRSMYRVANESGCLLIPAMSTRHSENTSWLREKLGSLTDSKFESGQASYLRARHIPGSAGFLSREQAGGGALIDLGVHVLDLALWLWGDDPVVAVTGKTKVDLKELPEEARVANDYGQEINVSEMDVEYEAQAEVEFKSGGKLNLHVSWASLDSKAVEGPTADETAPFVELSSRDGGKLTWSLSDGTIASGSSGTTEENRSSEPLQARYTRQIQYALAAAAGREDALARESEMLRLHEVIDAIYLSVAEGGRRVEFN